MSIRPWTTTEWWLRINYFSRSRTNIRSSILIMCSNIKTFALNTKVIKKKRINQNTYKIILSIHLVSMKLLKTTFHYLLERILTPMWNQDSTISISRNYRMHQPKEDLITSIWDQYQILWAAINRRKLTSWFHRIQFWGNKMRALSSKHLNKSLVRTAIEAIERKS